MISQICSNHLKKEIDYKEKRNTRKFHLSKCLHIAIYMAYCVNINMDLHSYSKNGQVINIRFKYFKKW